MVADKIVGMEREPTFMVRDVPVYGDVILSPMAAVSDVPCRAVSRVYGSAMQYTEFVAAEALLAPENSQWRRLDKKEGEYPLVFQIFGNNAETILAAAQKIEAWGPDIIDINMGCSVKQVSGRGAGVGMMRQPKLVADTFRLLTTHLSVPVTGKLRLGWSQEERNFLEIAKIMEDNGASLIAMHGRTKAQAYKGTADWDAIGELKQVVSVPVIGNGDVKKPADIDALKAHTGCDGVMVGRTAIGNPWILGRRERTEVPISEICEVVRLHVRENVAYYGNPRGFNLFGRHMRKYFYGRPVKPFMQRLLAIRDLDELDVILEQIEETLPVTSRDK